MTNQMLFFFSALGAFNGFMLSLYFAINANKKNFSNYFLSFLFLALSTRIIKSVFFYFNPQLSNIFIQIGLSACILIGPFLFLYLKAQTNNEKVNWGIHILPYLIGITVLGIVYPYVEHKAIWSKWIVKGIYIQWLVYISFSIKYILSIFHKLKKKENLTKMDVWLLSIYFGVALIWLAYCIAAYTSYIVGALSFTFILYLIILLLIFKNSQSSTFFQEKEKYKNKKLDAITIENINQKIFLIAEKELFLNQNLTLDETAKALKISKHLLSQYLNEKLGKSFTNFINEYRIEKAKELLQSKNNYTIEGLGYDSGFNSKSTFFTTFKRITGKTPSEFQKLHLK
jgi:AraC-like DNA-binding protein